MRSTIAIIVGLAACLPACGNNENAGQQAAAQQAAKEAKAKEVRTGGAAKVIKPPVPNGAKIPCSQLLDAAAIGPALGETEPVTIVDAKDDADAAASCSIRRGGKDLSMAEQKAMIKKNGKLGVQAGDEICNISAYCWTIENPEAFKQHCKDQMDASLGFPACVSIDPTGEHDVKRFRFYDDDTKCLLQARGGPRNVDNDLIGKCAKVAHDMIGPAQIAVHAGGATAPTATAPTGSGA